MEILKIIAYIFVGCSVLISLIRTIFLYVKNKQVDSEKKQPLSKWKNTKNIQNIYTKARIHNHGEPIDDALDRVSSLSISYQYKPGE